MKPTLYILCGIPGCGKSTWAEKMKSNYCRIVSRDEIRFSLVEENEDYFAHEDTVYARFCGTIAQTLIDGFDVIADATHLNKYSRKKLIREIDKYIYDYNIIYVIFSTPFETCVERNNAREGRRKVPEDVIYQMEGNFVEPRLDEDYRAIEVRLVKG